MHGFSLIGASGDGIILPVTTSIEPLRKIKRGESMNFHRVYEILDRDVVGLCISVVTKSSSYLELISLSNKR